MTDYTPAPWEFRVYASGCTIVSAQDAAGRSVRDSLKGVEVRVSANIADDQSNAHEASPDARLIAAAPELLEALQGLANALQAKPGRRGLLDAVPHQLEIARAVISKARGVKHA